MRVRFSIPIFGTRKSLTTIRMFFEECIIQALQTCSYNARIFSCNRKTTCALRIKKIFMQSFMHLHIYIYTTHTRKRKFSTNTSRSHISRMNTAVSEKQNQNINLHINSKTHVRKPTLNI